MQRRSRDQIAADCGLLPGEKPTPLQIRQSKEIARAPDAGGSTSKPQAPKRPKIKVPHSIPTVVSSQSIPNIHPSQSNPTIDATNSNPTIFTNQSKPYVQPKVNRMNKEIESEEKENKETAYNNPRFDNDDLDHLLGLMAMQENQDCLFGSGSITAVDGTTRAGCCEILATLMNVFHNNRNKKSSAHATNRMKLNGPGMMKRWRNIKDKYIETKQYFDLCTGSGLLDKDYEKGIDTSEKKKEQMCPRFQMIHEIYGHKANITPHAILDTVQSKDLSIHSHNETQDDLMIDPNLNAKYYYKQTQMGLGTPNNLEDRSGDRSQPQLDYLIQGEGNQLDRLSSRSSESGHQSPLPDLDRNEDQENYLRFSTPDLPSPKSPTADLPDPKSISLELPHQKSPTPESDLQSANEDGAQSIRKATRTARKKKQGAEPVSNRVMKPLPAVDPNPGRRKAPVSALVKERDEKRFALFDRKAEEKKQHEEIQIRSQGNIAQNALDWDKEKYESARVDSQRADIKKAQLESELVDQNINWEREKFNQENSRLFQAEKDRTEQQRIKTRREVMESCQVKGMSIQDIKQYMDLLFAE